jgi:hypothetical protein
MYSSLRTGAKGETGEERGGEGESLCAAAQDISIDNMVSCIVSFILFFHFFFLIFSFIIILFCSLLILESTF